MIIYTMVKFQQTLQQQNLFQSLLIVHSFLFITIKLAVYARHEEIEVLRLVGATDGFIKAPFYIEGLIQGLTGAVVALVTVAVLHFRIQRFIQVEQGLNFELDLLPPTMILWFLIGGMTLGLAGSAFSVGRHLKV